MSKLLNRFLEYVKYDTQSKLGADTVPSTAKQKALSDKLAAELKALNLPEAETDEHGYVYAAIPSNTDSTYTLGFIAHVDTATSVSGKDVKPVICENYDGGDIVLNGGTVLSPKEFPELNSHIGKTIISSDGTTLLGADDKAGVAVIMQLAEKLRSDPSIKHCNIKIAFTPDEEVGRGTAFFDVKKFGCDGAYTVDGGEKGELEYENFNAASAKIKITGKSVHPGGAKGKMINASLVLMELHSLLPCFDNPMYTTNYEGFYHLDEMSGNVDGAVADYIIRDFDKDLFERKKKFFAECVNFINLKYGEGVAAAEIKDTYYNMKEMVLPHMHLVENAKKAMEKAGVQPIVRPIRGGTDGATLSYKGLPCPNLFTGGYNFHGRYEYIPYEDMEKAYEVLLNIVELYKDR